MRKFRHARRLRGELMSEINITPFVDVLLVLLVSFLISAPLMTLALPIQLPKGKLKERAPDYENSILAVVNKKNQILTSVNLKISWFLLNHKDCSKVHVQSFFHEIEFILPFSQT